MPISTGLIKAAMAANAADPSLTQDQAAQNIEDAIIETIKTLSITYTTGLVAPPGGGAVTGDLSLVVIS